MRNKKADYIVSGSWSKKAFKEAQLYGEARCVASSEDEKVVDASHGRFSFVASPKRPVRAHPRAFLS